MARYPAPVSVLVQSVLTQLTLWFEAKPCTSTTGSPGSLAAGTSMKAISTPSESKNCIGGPGGRSADPKGASGDRQCRAGLGGPRGSHYGAPTSFQRHVTMATPDSGIPHFHNDV